jgi:hypothetical protein
MSLEKSLDFIGNRSHDLPAMVLLLIFRSSLLWKALIKCSLSHILTPFLLRSELCSVSNVSLKNYVDLEV